MKQHVVRRDDREKGVCHMTVADTLLIPCMHITVVSEKTV